MMCSETLDIIKICKGHHTRKEEGLTAYAALKQYYIDQYCLYAEHYDEIGLHAMVKRAFYNYLDHADRPSIVLTDFEDAMNHFNCIHFIDYSVDLAAMISALTVCRVRYNGEYINGFDDGILGSVILGGGN